MGNRTEHGSGTVVGGGSAAPSGTTALLPLYYRLGENNTREVSPSGSGCGRPQRQYRSKRYYRGTERYYRLGAFKLPKDNRGMLHVAGRLCGCIWVVYVLIPPIPSKADLLLIVRVPYDSNPPKEIVRKQPSSLFTIEGNKPSRAT